jgi:ribonuclease R
MIVPGKEQGARAGQIVVAEISDPPTAYRGPLGVILSVLGERLQPSLLVEMAIASHDLPHEWPPEVLREAAQIEPEVTAAEREGLVDLRKTPLVTIDGADARDFDDAVFAEPARWRLAAGCGDCRCVALRAWAVRSTRKPTSAAPRRTSPVSSCRCCRKRCPTASAHSIRKSIACAWSATCRSMRKARSSSRSSTRAVMRSHARLTYDIVWQAIGEKDADARHEVADVLPQLENLHALYKAMAEQRRQRGAIDFETPEVKFRLDQTGEVEAVGAVRAQRCAQADRGMHDRRQRAGGVVPRKT